MSIHRSRAAKVAVSFSLAGMIAACGGGNAATKAPATPAAAPAAHAATSAPQVASASVPPKSPKAAVARERGSDPRSTDETDEDDAELVVAREVVASCPTLRLVRQHIGELDQDTIWLAVLESIADCMSQGGAMAQQAIGVSGDEEHRNVVREILGSRGVAPTRVIAKVAQGAAECQGGTNCSKRVEITIVAP